MYVIEVIPSTTVLDKAMIRNALTNAKFVANLSIIDLVLPHIMIWSSNTNTISKRFGD